jgi:arsenate reductase
LEALSRKKRNENASNPCRRGEGYAFVSSPEIEKASRSILFVCVHNSARSQMAEAFVNRLCSGRFSAESAGLERGALNPYVVEAMREIGYELSGNATKEVLETNEAHGPFDYVVTVCDETNGARCPIVPIAGGVRLHWSFDDPSGFEGTREEILPRVRVVRDAIEAKIVDWCKTACA